MPMTLSDLLLSRSGSAEAVDLADDGTCRRESGLDGQMSVRRASARLDALARVHHKQGPAAASERLTLWLKST